MYDFPVVFERTRKVCRIFQILAQRFASKCSPSLSEEPIELSPWNFLVVPKSTLQRKQSKIKQLILAGSPNEYLMLQNSPATLANLHLFEKILFCLKEERWSLPEISSLPDKLALPLLEVIRYTRLN